MAYFGLLSRRTLFGATIGGAVAFMITGVILWGGFNTAMEATNTMDFCISCHEMESTVYQEYQDTIHYSNRSGVQAGCPDCHVPRDWVHKTVRKIEASRELYHKALGTVNTPEKFDQHRPEMALRVWKTMKETNSRECRNCHDFDTMNPANQKKRARAQHLFAMEEGHTCIDCHKGIAHKGVTDQFDPEVIAELEQAWPAYQQSVPPSFIAGMELAESREAAAEQEEREANAAAREQQAQQIQAAIAKAVAGHAAAGTAVADGPAAGGSAADSGFGLAWDSVPSQQLTLFYPGQTSMEWVLNGSKHGGARVYTKAGDRCLDCHKGEEEMMGRKMVTGEKAEATPIPDKRPGIPLEVQAAHDGDHLYMRFTWPEANHVPVPFAEGGKMDPENPVKFAMMFGGDEADHANQSGCWGTCHHDARTMPDAPEAESLKGHPLASRLGLTGGVTKYLAATRTAIQGRSSPLGGWDKLKDEAAIKAELEAGRFLDLVRYSAGTGKTEDGFILDHRVMEGDSNGVEFTHEKTGGNWVVTLRRKLNPGGDGNIAIEKGKLYNVGFAIHDDFADARFHHVSLGFKMGLDNDEAEINITEK